MKHSHGADGAHLLPTLRRKEGEGGVEPHIRDFLGYCKIPEDNGFHPAQARELGVSPGHGERQRSRSRPVSAFLGC